MPELPEVETVRRSLLGRVAGRQIVGVQVCERRLRRPIAEDFERRLEGRRVAAIARRGKYLLFELDGDEVLLVHLGMSGRLTLRDGDAPLVRHDHVALGMADGSRLVFHDPRRFGVMRVARLGELGELRELGLDPLEGGWNEAELRVLLRRRAPVKNVLLDQRVFAGIGNIYASEILFQARVRPQRRAAALRLREIRALAVAIRSVLAEAVRLGGSSISDFRDGAGRYGKFQHQLAVYDRAGDVCRECSNEIRRLVLAGRSSFYCPACQR